MNPRGRMGETPPACRGATEHVRRVTGGHFLPSGTTRKRHSHDTCGAGLFVSSCETLPASAGLPLAAGHQHSNQVTLDQGPIGPQDLLAGRIDLRARDLPALPARGRSLRAGTPPRYPKAAWVTPERQAARDSIMVKIGSKAPANVRTLFPHPPLTQNSATLLLHKALATIHRCISALPAPAFLRRG
jgi:hypothetical protein